VSTTANTTINATLGSTISVSTSSTVAIGVTPTAGGVVSSASDTVSVSTNNALGYVLTVLDTDTVTNLVSGANTIAAHSGTRAVPTVLAANTWGYRFDDPAAAQGSAFGAGPTTAETNNASSTTLWAGMPASSGTAQILKTTATVASADTTTVWYGVKATTAKPNGVYTDTVTYTATTN
jgi:hypothetical protein